MTKVYKKAFTEAYEILSYLDEENYKKIPNDIMDTLYENRDINYEFFIDESIPLSDQDLLEETKALLFNLYRDYLADLQTKKKIIKDQRDEQNELEEIKREKYNYNDLFKKKEEKIKTNNTVTEKECTDLIKNEIKSNVFTKLVNKIKKYLFHN